MPSSSDIIHVPFYTDDYEELVVCQALHDYTVPVMKKLDELFATFRVEMSKSFEETKKRMEPVESVKKCLVETEQKLIQTQVSSKTQEPCLKTGCALLEIRDSTLGLSKYANVDGYQSASKVFDRMSFRRKHQKRKKGSDEWLKKLQISTWFKKIKLQASSWSRKIVVHTNYVRDRKKRKKRWRFKYKSTTITKTVNKEFVTDKSQVMAKENSLFASNTTTSALVIIYENTVGTMDSTLEVSGDISPVINTQEGYLSDDLSIFSKWPILPVEDHCLIQLIVNSNVIRNDGWSENMSSLLLKCGCRFLNRELPVEHPQLETFVQPPTATGILNALLAVSGGQENIKGIFLNSSEGELHELRNFILQSKWFSGGQMNEVHLETIKHLPIFQSYRNRKLVSLNCPGKWLKPEGIREDLLDDNFIRLDSEREINIFKRYLQIEEPSRMEFYKACVLNRMSEFLFHQEALLTILHDLNDLVAADSSLHCALSTTPFILAANGLWQQPSRLYDPRVSGLQELLHKEIYFPSEKFLDSKILDALVGLGLRTTLDCSAYLDAARTVSILHDSGDLEAPRYRRRLFFHIKTLSVKLSSKTGEANHDESQNLMSTLSEDSSDGETYPEYETETLLTEQSENEFWCQLRSIPWCPICLDPPIEGIPWLECSNLVASPDRVRPKPQMFLVSATMHLLDGECHSLYLHQKLRWMDCLSIDVLCRQLIETSKSYKEQKSRSSVNPDFESMIQSQIPLLYSRLQEHAMDNDSLALTYALKGVPWVWLGDDFVSADVLSFDSPSGQQWKKKKGKNWRFKFKHIIRRKVLNSSWRFLFMGPFPHLRVVKELRLVTHFITPLPILYGSLPRPPEAPPFELENLLCIKDSEKHELGDKLSFKGGSIDSYLRAELGIYKERRANKTFCESAK